MWEPIETAPKDCSKILLFSKNDEVCIGWVNSKGFPYWDVKDEDSIPAQVKPTHWMPLPKPPEE